MPSIPRLSGLTILAALSLVGLIVLAAIHAASGTLDQVTLILVAASAGNELPRVAQLVTAVPPADTPAPVPAPAPAPAAAPAPAPYPVSNA